MTPQGFEPWFAGIFLAFFDDFPSENPGLRTK